MLEYPLSQYTDGRYVYTSDIHRQPVRNEQSEVLPEYTLVLREQLLFQLLLTECHTVYRIDLRLITYKEFHELEDP